MPHEPDTRLTGWKEIAAYLRKDVRTVLRWERERGLPVHRPPGRRGQSVYAIPKELDNWIQLPATGHEPAAAASPLPVVPTRRTRGGRYWLAAVLMLMAAVSFAAWPHRAMTRVAVTGNVIRAFDGDGRELWTYGLGADSVTPSVENGVGRATHVGDIDGDGRPEALVSVVTTTNSPNVVRGLVFCFDAGGGVRWSRELDDVLTFEGRRFGAPWAVGDLMVFGGDRKAVGITAHHFTWWPSMVVTLDAATGERRARYVHPGWVMRIDVTPDLRHVVAAGINNARDAHAVMVLDANTLEERFYSLLLRPDAGAAMREPLDRQHYWISQTGPPTIRLGHSRSLSPVPETIVELSDDLRGLRASQSDSYWAWHGALERDGHLKHSADQCPERSAPPFETRPHQNSQ